MSVPSHTVQLPLHSRLLKWSSPLVLLAYTLLTVVMTWPVAAHLGTMIPGNEGDAWMNLWTFAWVKSALFSGQTPFYTHLLYYPDGVSLLFHNISWFHSLSWLFLQKFIGAGAAYSLLLLGGYVFNAFATYLLARELTGSQRAAFVAGLVMGFWPYALSHQNHLTLTMIAWLPLALLFLHRTMTTGQIRPAIWAGVCLALLALSRWHLLMMSAPLLVIFVLHRWLTDKTSHTRQVFYRVVLVVALTALLIAPFLTPIVIGQLTREHPEDLFITASDQTDLLAYVVPNRYHPLWGESAFALYDAFGANKFFVAFLGYTTCLVALVGLIRRWQKTSVWFLLALTCFLLALGPTLIIKGQEIGSLPWGWLHQTFLLRVIRAPDRFNVLLGLPFALLVAWGIESWQGRKRTLAAALVSLLILFEYIVTYPLLPLSVSPWYAQIAQEPATFALLEIPVGSRSYDKEYMFYQMTHGKPLVTGHVSRLPREAFAFINANPFLNGLTQTNRPSVNDVGHQMQVLSEAGVRYVVLHKKYLTDEAEQQWRLWFTIPPVYEDEAIFVYPTTPESYDLPLRYSLRTGVADEPVAGIVQATLATMTPHSGDSLNLELSWRVLEAVPTTANLCFYVVNRQEQETLLGCEALSDMLPATGWQNGELVHTAHTLSLEPDLLEGTYRFAAAIQLPDWNSSTPVSLATITIYPAEPLFAAPVPSVPANITWSDTIGLVGYDLTLDQDLALTLYWQALKQPPQAYKIFFHLMDPITGQVLVQADTMPQNWNYPMNLWQTGEYVLDRITLPLADVPPGTYILKIGLYDPDTSLRLDTDFPDDAAVLTEVVIQGPPEP